VRCLVVTTLLVRRGRGRSRVDDLSTRNMCGGMVWYGMV
jgi:hypothetical protein